MWNKEVFNCNPLTYSYRSITNTPTTVFITALLLRFGTTSELELITSDS